MVIRSTPSNNNTLSNRVHITNDVTTTLSSLAPKARRRNRRGEPRVLKRDIPWETYMTTKLITGTCFELLRRYDKRSESYRATLFDDLQGPFIRMKLTSFKLISLNITPWKHLRVIEKSPQNNKEAFNEVDEIPKSDPSLEKVQLEANPSEELEAMTLNPTLRDFTKFTNFDPNNGRDHRISKARTTGRENSQSPSRIND
ncbi:hypothetical protein GIB67_032257 [Kingdonia uniflora]|uniref:Uncharacterized protein n=1 Tax=Kingdonia uniflora TaxID=39325 RepID=A0A7J7MX75_9MAGN|nr:hypothetical protein GIB67_032257 [Kingdonia uniflora]